MPSEEQLVQLLEALAPGSSMWMTTRGTSMFPLLRTGDAVRVLRCDETEVSRGDLAIVKSRDGQLLAHLVVGQRPLTTATWSGIPDRDGARLLGRAIAIRRRGRAWPLPRASRTPLYVAHRLWVVGQRGVLGRVSQRALRSVQAGAAGQVARRVVRPRLVVRALRPTDEAVLIAHLPARLARTREDLQRWLEPPRLCVGAFLGHRLGGLACVEPVSGGQRLSHLQVRGLWRGWGVEQALVQALVSLASPLRILLRPGNAEVEASFRGLGYEPVSADATWVGWSPR